MSRPPSANSLLRNLKRETRSPIASSGTESIFLPNHSGDHSKGKVRTNPVQDTDIANKTYIDSKKVEVFPTDFTDGSIIFAKQPIVGDTVLAEDNSNLFWNHSTSNLGIGTALPTSNVHIKGTDPLLTLEDDTPGAIVSFLADATFATFGTSSNHALTITTNSLACLSLDASQNVETAGNLTVLGATASAGDVSVINASNPKIVCEDTTNTTKTLIQSQNTFGLVGTSSNHPFYIISNSSIAIALDGSQNVGVGTTSPAEVFQVVGSSRFGDQATNYVKITGAGNMFFVGTAGLPFAEIYAQDINSTVTITIAGKSNKVQVTAFNVNGNSNNCTPDHTNDHITITKAGMYKCSVSLAIESPAASPVQLGASVWKNNGATEFANVHAHRDMAGGSADRGSVCMSGIVDLAVNDTIELWVWNETSTDNFLIDDVTLSLFQIGGT